MNLGPLLAFQILHFFLQEVWKHYQVRKFIILREFRNEGETGPMNQSLLLQSWAGLWIHKIKYWRDMILLILMLEKQV